MNERPITPRERIEARRKEREFRREFLRHYKYNPWRVYASVHKYLSYVKTLSVEAYSKNLDNLLKAASLIPKFCNGLTGVSFTDSVTAPAI
ncbi:MAG: hypothetical protein JGK17_31840 [Microcoleus sp. PH2017_10_PVI_O_A]|uniref:hypothetical protein n=1 Tax=unclassified Microcoleus TaxID=2642155 RepID=UPI001DE368F2|nr:MULTISPECIES: hypothetical protein [unclassified Microcoleus]MCC3410046.1 hypothetical protein [Microcoleus sp. PH2017_10_PVI_O_A]MCC3463796.1 hypothetical protein [Microcoleus sp. PH2017_11_PCY_U_A]MCC3563635.1 hypothetical protein [Microcoleus sp. PH2017_27_LUM_O_A]TAE86324.1 MAG: hypothetical protein EAZ83_00440 [Oscillatoriales cyanobacterium]